MEWVTLKCEKESFSRKGSNFHKKDQRNRYWTVFSSPELAQGELLGYRDVRRTCGRPRRTRRLSVNFLACVHSRGNSFDPKFKKLCQNVNHHNI